jgi:hypothetical protein
MKVEDKRNLTVNAGDIVVIDGKKYLVIFDRSCIAYHFLDLETMEFDVEEHTDLSPLIGEEIKGLGKIVEVIKEKEIKMVIGW